MGILKKNKKSKKDKKDKKDGKKAKKQRASFKGAQKAVKDVFNPDTLRRAGSAMHFDQFDTPKDITPNDHFLVMAGASIDVVDKVGPNGLVKEPGDNVYFSFVRAKERPAKARKVKLEFFIMEPG